MPSGYVDDEFASNNAQNLLDELIYKVRLKIPSGESSSFCLDCGENIPKARQKALPGVKCCISCQSIKEGKYGRL